MLSKRTLELALKSFENSVYVLENWKDEGLYSSDDIEYMEVQIRRRKLMIEESKTAINEIKETLSTQK